MEAARRKFSPEFMNRLDKVVVFHPLQREQLEEVLNIELGQVQRRVLETAKGQFLFRVTDAGRDFLLREGTDQRYGARHLKRAIERTWFIRWRICWRPNRCISATSCASIGTAITIR